MDPSQSDVGASVQGKGGEFPPLFQVAADTIRSNIETKRLPPRTVLLEGALAEVLQMSRAPVKRALALLQELGLVSRFDGRGYVVGRSIGDAAPDRTDIRSLDLDLSRLIVESNRPNWIRIHDEVEAELTRCLIFGQFRIVENLLADHYSVSRTVARDVLGRLQERGVVSKNATSRWIVEPLTAQMIRDRFEMRVVLEVAALTLGAGMIDRAALQTLAQRLEAAQIQGLCLGQACALDLMIGFADLLLLASPNPMLAAYVGNNRKTVEALHRALKAMGLPDDPATAAEIEMIVQLLLVDAVPSAATLFERHLLKLRDRTISQLKIVSVVSAPQDLPSYVVPERMIRSALSAIVK